MKEKTNIIWVDVKTDLPEDNIDVLAFLNDDRIIEALFDRSVGWDFSSICDDIGDARVKYWTYYNLP